MKKADRLGEEDEESDPAYVVYIDDFLLPTDKDPTNLLTDLFGDVLDESDWISLLLCNNFLGDELGDFLASSLLTMAPEPFLSPEA